MTGVSATDATLSNSCSSRCAVVAYDQYRRSSAVARGDPRVSTHDRLRLDQTGGFARSACGERAEFGERQVNQDRVRVDQCQRR